MKIIKIIMFVKTIQLIAINLNILFCLCFSH